MENEIDHLTHDQLNAKYGHKGKFFETKDQADEYKSLYKKRNPFRFCVIYPIRDAIMDIDHTRTRMMNDGLVYYKVMEYKRIGFLVSAPE